MQGISINEIDETITYDAYVKRGSVSYLRKALEPDDPDHLYNYLSNNGIEPELYGVFHPIKNKDYEKMSRADLIQEIYKIKSENYKSIK